MAEKEHRWFKVMDISEVKGNYLPVNKVSQVVVNGKKVCLGRLNDGFYALKDSCPHAGGSLGKGWLENEVVVCPLHRIKFNIKNGENTTGEGYRARTYPTEIRDDGLYIGFPVTKWFPFW